MNQSAFGFPSNPEQAISDSLAQSLTGAAAPGEGSTPPGDLPGYTRWIILGLYALAAAVTVYFYRFEIDPDGLVYIGLAKQYSSGNLLGAVNGYWSPLYSLLLSPLLKARIPEFLATKVLAALIGAVTLFAVSRLGRNFGMSDLFRAVLGLTVIPIALCFGMRWNTPDFLAATILLLYAAVLTHPKFFDHWYSGLLLGALGGLGYLAKAYIFYFILLHLIIVGIVWFLMPRNKESGKAPIAFFMALIGFALLSLPWIVLLTRHYQTVTISEAGTYTLHLIAPGNGSGDPAMKTAGFLPPPSPHASSAWNDPVSLPTREWSGSIRDRGVYVMKHMLRETVLFWQAMQRSCPIWLPILIAGALIAGSRIDPRPQHPVLLLVLTVAIFPTGYLFLVLEPRYLEMMPLLLLVLAGFFVQTAARSTGATRLQMYGVLILICGLFAVRPAVQLWRARHIGLEYHQISRQLSMIPSNSRIASNTDWLNSLFVTYLRGGAYWGMPKTHKPGDSAADIERDLKQDRIQYFMVWSEDPNPPDFITGWEDVTKGQIPALQVYRVPLDNP